MKDNFKGIVLLIVAAAAGFSADMNGYSIICFTVAGIALIFGVKFLFETSNPTRLYESNVRNILNTFDSILVKSNTVPKLEGRNIIYVESMDDLIDAQLEIRKPICYYKQTESCSFALLDDKEAYIYIEKLSPDVVSPLEIEIKENKLKTKNADEMDSEMLRDIEKTTIVKLSNKKSYKVSPIRKDKKKEENKEEIKEDKKEDKKEEEILEAAVVEEPKKDKVFAKSDDIETFFVIIFFTQVVI